MYVCVFVCSQSCGFVACTYICAAKLVTWGVGPDVIFREKCAIRNLKFCHLSTFLPRSEAFHNSGKPGYEANHFKVATGWLHVL